MLISCNSSKVVLSNEENYNQYVDEIVDAEIFMPILTELGAYVFIDVYYYESKFIFVSQSINLIVTYSEDEYFINKSNIEDKYSFLTEPIVIDKDSYRIPETEVTVNGFFIKVVNNDLFSYPHKFGLIGFSDSTFQISYMFYYNKDHSLISNMSDFIDAKFVFSNNQSGD